MDRTMSEFVINLKRKHDTVVEYIFQIIYEFLFSQNGFLFCENGFFHSISISTKTENLGENFFLFKVYHFQKIAVVD